MERGPEQAQHLGLRGSARNMLMPPCCTVQEVERGPLERQNKICRHSVTRHTYPYGKKSQHPPNEVSSSFFCMNPYLNIEYRM